MLVSALFLGVSLGSFGFGSGHSESTTSATTDTLPCVSGCVSQEQYEAMRRLAAKRLRGWNRANRQVVHLRRAMRAQVSLGGWGLARAFLCIHGGEGSWSANTGNGYHGGLQMDRGFMSTYGGTFYRAWGGAENWPSFVQITVAMNAYLSGRGFYPWPNTARACGLL